MGFCKRFCSRALVYVALVGLAACGATSNQTATQPTVTAVALSPAAIPLMPGGSQQLTVNATETTGDVITVTQGVTYSSDTPTVATVSATGLVSAQRIAGTANITATVAVDVNTVLTSNPAVVTVTIPPPTLVSIAVTPAATTLATGATQQLTVTGTYSDGSKDGIAAGISYVSSATATAEVSGSGLVTAGTTPGTATITVTDTATGKTASATITISTPAPKLVSIALSPLNVSVAAGGTQQLTVTGTYSNGATAALAASAESFTSMTPGVASVSAAGLVTVAAGATTGATATIVAKDTASGISTTTTTSTVITVTAAASTTSGVLSTGFNSNGTTTTPTAITGTYSVYAGGANNPANGSGGGYADQGASPSYEYIYIQDTSANVSGYTYEGIGIQPGTNQIVSTSGFNALSFTLAVNPEWFAAGTPNFVVLVAGKVTGVSSSTCNPSVAAVVTATASAATQYSVPLTAFTKITQNCGVASVTIAQILAAPLTEIDFQADGGSAAITASGLTSNTNATVAAAGSSPATYPTTINVVGTVAFVTASVQAPSLVSIAETPLTASIAAGATEQLSVTGTYSNNTTAPLTLSGETFTSMSPSVATVSAGGLVTVAAGAATGATAEIVATDTASGLSSSAANSTVITVAAPAIASTPVLSTGFNSNKTTTTSTAATGTWTVYAGGKNNPANGSGGGYADQSVSPSYEYEYLQDTAANIAGYTYQGIGILAATGQTVSASGYNSIGFTLAVNPEWVSAGTPNFVVLIMGNVAGVSSSTCNPSVAAVVSATAATATAYTVPLTAFTLVTQNCGVTSVTAAQILAAPIAEVDFQADGGTAAITVGSLTSNTNTSVAATGSSPATYPTTINVVGGVQFMNASSTSGATTTVLSTGFNSNNTTTTSTSATGTWNVYAGGANNPANGNGGGYADQGQSPSYEYEFVQDIAANLAGYTYQGIGILAATGQSVSAASAGHISFTLAVNPEWISAGTPNFVVLIAAHVTGVSSSTCNPSVAAVVTATSSTATAYTVPLSAFTKVAQNCGVASVTAAQILAAPITEVDFQADSGTGAITASGLTSNINTTVPAANSSPPTYPTTINVVGGVSFVP